VALPLARLVDAAQPAADRAGAGTLLRRSAAGLAAIVVLLFAFSEIGAVYRQQHNPNFISTAADRAYMISAIDRVTRPGNCVLTDQVSYTVAADRFVSDVPGCSLEDDGIGADLALSHGRTPSSGAGNVPAVAAMWSDAFRHAQFVLLTGRSYKRVAWTPALHAYFNHHFRLVADDPERDDLYARTGPGPG
jgi:hypothetical protein